MKLEPEQIQKILKKPKNANLIKLAVERHEELKHFYTDFKPELVFKKVSQLLTPEKMDSFRTVYKNHAKALINKVVTHYQKVYEAHGRVFDFDFKNGIKDLTKFTEVRKSLYRGKSDNDYWQENGHKLCFVEPSSLHLKGLDKSGNPIVMKVPIEAVYDIEANEGGIEYVIILEKKEDDKYYHVYDQENYYVYESSSDGFRIAESEDGFMAGPHNAGRCPIDFIYDDDETTDNFIVKRNPISDSIPSLYSYVILRTFYENYKYFAAFGREIKPEARCDYKDHSRGLECYGGMLAPMSLDVTLENPEECPSCSKKKNKSVMGEIYEIPINMQSNPDFIKALPNLYHRYDADSNVLKFQAEDIDNLKKEITDDCIGVGFSMGGTRTTAINMDQVRSNFDDQESNLVWFSKNIENTWSADLQTISNILNYKSDINLKLGRKYFLKSTSELYGELKVLQESTSSEALIGYKIEEIAMTENKHNERFLLRKRILDILQPYSSFTSKYVSDNRESLSPESVLMYNRFSEVLSEFEFLNGRVETFGVEIEDKSRRIELIKTEFYKILNQIENGRYQETGES